MSENKNHIVGNIPSQEKLSVAYILEQIRAIQTQTDYMQNAVLGLLETHSGGPGDIGAQERARALGVVVESREATNQRLIAFYEKLYDDMKPGKVDAVVNVLLDIMDDSRLPESMQDCVQNHLHNLLSDLVMNLDKEIR